MRLWLPMWQLVDLLGLGMKFCELVETATTLTVHEMMS